MLKIPVKVVYSLLRGFLAIVLFAFACHENLSVPTVGQPVSEIVLPDLEGGTFRLSEHRGKVVIINFWASWCPPCVDEMPSLERLHRALRDKGLEVVAISVDDSIEVIERFQRENGLSFTMLFDEDAKVAHGFQTFKYPETYIVDKEGRLLSKIVGPRNWITPAIMLEVVGLLKSDKPLAPTGGSEGE